MTQSVLFDLSEFEVFQGQGRKRSSPVFALQARGALSANGTAFEELGRPEFVTLLFNPKTQQIAVKVATKSMHAAMRMRPNGKGTGAMVSAKAFMAAYGLPDEVYTALEIVALQKGLAVLQVPGVAGEGE